MCTRERRQREVADREQRFLDTAQELIQRDGLHLHYLLDGYGWQPLADAGDDIALDALVDRVCRAVFGDDCPPTPSDLFKTPGTSHG